MTTDELQAIRVDAEVLADYEFGGRPYRTILCLLSEIERLGLIIWTRCPDADAGPTDGVAP
jgi:hypothetical protein